MYRRLIFVVACLVGGLLKCNFLLAAQTAAATHKTKSPASHLQLIYKLEFESGSPVIKGFMLNGHALRPMLDTGVTELVVPPAVFARLHVREVSKDIVGDAVGSTGDADSGVFQMRLPFSGRVSWRDVAAADTVDPDEPVSNALIPLSALDADYVMLLLSRKQLVLEDRMPNPSTPDLVMKEIPYFECTSGIFVTLRCNGKDYLAQIDTGGDGTDFTDNFIKLNPALFIDAGHTDKIGSVFGEVDSKLYHLTPGTSILGVEASDDLQLTADVNSIPGYAADGSAAPAGEQGDPSSMPFNRPDSPQFTPVASIGMDVLGKFDLLFDRRDHMLVLWDPAETAKLFPETRKPHRTRSKKK